jgi:serine/threonine-protein kinase HipA
MVFNVLAHNRDDHANQHAFLMTADGRWELAPAYDLTFSRGPGAEHYLDVGGRGGDDITRTQIEALGKIHGLSKKRADAIISEVSEAVSDFRSFAATYAVSPRTLVLVENAIGAGLRRISSPGFTPPGTL